MNYIDISNKDLQENHLYRVIKVLENLANKLNHNSIIMHNGKKIDY